MNRIQEAWAFARPLIIRMVAAAAAVAGAAIGGGDLLGHRVDVVSVASVSAMAALVVLLQWAATATGESHTFAVATIERAGKTFAQALLAVASAYQVGILDVHWSGALATAGLAAGTSVLTSLASLTIGSPVTPSLVRPAETFVPTPRPEPVDA